LIYRTLPIEVEMAEMMLPFCDKVLLSKNHAQSNNEFNIEVMHDDVTIEHHGPATALLTAAKKYSGASILFLGCDYPFFDQTMLQRLVNARNLSSEIICYYHPLNGFAEPLLALYEARVMSQLSARLEACHFSLQKLIHQSASLFLVPQKLEALQSIDTTSQRENLLKK
jgi:molybdopterin-guanine dinucleotide biosynthesis protein A